jgi:hypothetical protein
MNYGSHSDGSEAWVKLVSGYVEDASFDFHPRVSYVAGRTIMVSIFYSEFSVSYFARVTVAS